ncbi:hypothetical protein [Halorarum salinum]|uniref:Uncharacterized protein n=1 Tax=Halorarum salinum TaxID=2743089 RepID=A0A7D5L9W6_9EURY|nr:hypothetical protein [Halobaculum salinum]QLG61633.1 hypothetical protein HUG12_07795 [Halobaculum salinum]
MPPNQSASFRRVGRLLAALSVVAGAVAGVVLLLPDPLADVFYAWWVLVGALLLPLAGAVGAWTGRTALVPLAALLEATLAVVGTTSIGFLLAPAALLLLGSALCSRAAGPRRADVEAITADPPTAAEVGRRALAGVASAGMGAALVYLGAIRRELFGACATETLACALDRAHPDAIALTVLGLLAVGGGGWLVRRVVHVSRALGFEYGSR